MELFMILPSDESGRYMILKDSKGDLHWMTEDEDGDLYEFPPMDDPWDDGDEDGQLALI